MRYLVIGSEGLIGRALCKLLCNERDSAVVQVDSVLPVSTDKRTACYQIDISETKKLIDLFCDERIDIAFNLAGVFKASQREDIFRINCFAPIKMLEEAKGKEFSLVLLGSAAEYGAVSDGVKISEQAPLFALSDYAISKASQTLMAQRLARTNDKPKVIIARPFNVIEAGISDSLCLGAFALQIAKIEKGLQPPIIEVGNLKSVRDFLSVNKLAYYLKVIGEKGRHGHVYNICSGYPRTIESVLQQLLSLAKKEIQVLVNPSKFKPGDSQWSVGDHTKLSKLVAVSRTDDEFKFCLQETLNWYRARIT